VAALSWKASGRPVRVELQRNEEFYTVTRHSSIVTIKTGVKRDGRMVARQINILWGAGAYADVSPRLIKNGGYGSPGPYTIPHIAVDSYAIYTNTTPSGGVRGYSIPQVAWAYESHLDEIAHPLGSEPIGQRRGLHDVAKQHRNLLDFPREHALGVRSSLRAGLRR